MFAQNIGTIDRVIRVVLGIALLAGFFLNPEAGLRWLYLIGIVPLVTGLFSSCPLYSLLGISTCATRRNRAGPRG